jgi:hypothetical protein
LNSAPAHSAGAVVLSAETTPLNVWRKRISSLNAPTVQLAGDFFGQSSVMGPLDAPRRRDAPSEAPDRRRALPP